MDHIFRFHTNIYKEKGKFIMKKITRRSFLAAMGIVGASAAFLFCQLDRYFRNGIHRSRERSC